ncbi:uncharacterized protein F5891DRAFT_1036098 [Suillus fuscotomentosus]|uniref:Uncharacterized protein n=1 Tax=Suillus fuscotomentosus TaxID=1912939 RepID=A0AAD4E5G6_9AGAM|nr:uncharacterized protein F5891DRAFT_1036098 [Suillus fuscotomentosus]KAG1900098.1 hypothetical protein F5891DRAFT_1036098 [Suillus fuscotomentosus]
MLLVGLNIGGHNMDTRDNLTRAALVQYIPSLNDSSLLKPDPQPVFTFAPHYSQPWQPIPSCSSNPTFSFSEEDFPPLKSKHTQGVPGPSNLLKQSGPVNLYPTPPSSTSPSKCTIPLPEERGEFTPIFTTHSPGVLDSPTVMRREDLACHRPLTPPPTQLLYNLELPGYEDDIDVSMCDESGHAIHQSDFEEDFYDGISAMSDSSAESDSPLSPLSPPWKPPLEHGLVNSHWNDPPSPKFSWSPCSGSEDIGDMSVAVSNDTTSFSSDQAPYLPGPRPRLVPLHIPWSSHQHIPMHQLDEHPPSSPQCSAFSSTDMVIDDPPELRSPHLSLSGLPELEHEKALPHIPPSSPSRRSCSSLPDDTDLPYSPPSPGPSLLSLPGADTDDNLLPSASAFLPLSSLQTVPFVPSQPLLFIHDPRDVPLPRSPSPEDFNLCLSVHDMDNDPELAQLFELRKRSLAAVQGSCEGLEGTDAYTRKSAEVGALLRLKLGDKLGMDVNEGRSPERRKKGVIGSISQLVAQMVLRRHEASRPLAKRKSVLSAQEYVHSPLSACIACDP